LHIRQRSAQRGGGNQVGEAAVEGVGGEVHVGHHSRRTIGADETAQVGDLVAVGEKAGVQCLADTEAGNAELSESLEFASLADAVLVEVLPHLEAGEIGVQRIHRAVAVAVLSGECRKTIRRIAACRKLRAVAEQLRAVVYDAVTIPVQHQHTVRRRHPARAALDAVTVVIEQEGVVALAATVSMPLPFRSSTSGSTRGGGTARAAS